MLCRGAGEGHCAFDVLSGADLRRAREERLRHAICRHLVELRDIVHDPVHLFH